MPHMQRYWNAGSDTATSSRHDPTDSVHVWGMPWTGREDQPKRSLQGMPGKKGMCYDLQKLI